ncbi:FAD-dependent oxidoreductase [Nocardia heshunensis]
MHDVVIVGAGPVGLFLACELGLAGCSVLVLEREPEPGSPWRAEPLGLRGLTATSLEAFHRRGLLHPLLKASGVPDDPAATSDSDEPSRPRFGGQFGGMMADPADIDLAALPFRLPTPAPEFMMTSLETIESLLSGRAGELGVEIRRGVAVSAVTQDERGAIAYADDRAYPARWIVGCDGGRSVVRGLAGFEFVGSEPQLTGYAMHVTLADPEQLRPGYNLTSTGMYLRMPTPGHIGMMDFDGGAYDRSQPPTLDHLQAVLRRVSGTHVTVREVHLASSFTDRAMQATTYRRGRVLLAGDAAHIHSPLGGQGLNAGIGDALNLGWKLAAVVHGHTPNGLLDTYTGERHPVGADVLDWSRAQVATMRPDPYARAIRRVMRDLLETGDGTTYVYERTTGAWIHYDLGDTHPLVGRTAPDFRLTDGTRLADLMHEGHGVALDFGDTRALHDTWMHRPGRIRYVSATARNDLGLRAVLIRPDGVVAWATDGEPNPATFEQAANRWFGSPRS